MLELDLFIYVIILPEYLILKDLRIRTGRGVLNQSQIESALNTLYHINQFQQLFIYWV